MVIRIYAKCDRQIQNAETKEVLRTIIDRIKEKTTKALGCIKDLEESLKNSGSLRARTVNSKKKEIASHKERLEELKTLNDMALSKMRALESSHDGYEMVDECPEEVVVVEDQEVGEAPEVVEESEAGEVAEEGYEVIKKDPRYFYSSLTEEQLKYSINKAFVEGCRFGFDTLVRSSYLGDNTPVLKETLLICLVKNIEMSRFCRGNMSCEEMVAYLLDVMKIDIDSTDTNGSTALLIAAERGLPTLISLLISRGADKSIVNKFGETFEERRRRQLLIAGCRV